MKDKLIEKLEKKIENLHEKYSEMPMNDNLAVLNNQIDIENKTNNKEKLQNLENLIKLFDTQVENINVSPDPIKGALDLLENR